MTMVKVAPTRQGKRSILLLEERVKRCPWIVGRSSGRLHLKIANRFRFEEFALVAFRLALHALGNRLLAFETRPGVEERTVRARVQGVPAGCATRVDGDLWLGQLVSATGTFERHFGRSTQAAPTGCAVVATNTIGLRSFSFLLRLRGPGRRPGSRGVGICGRSCPILQGNLRFVFEIKLLASPDTRC